MLRAQRTAVSSRWPAVAATLATVFGPAHAEAPPDPTTISARKHKSDPEWNFLAYQHMDQLYNTLDVAVGNTIWPLNRSQRSITGDFVFEVAGVRTTLTRFLADTRVNALLVLKGGEIVSEIYRHGSAPDTRFVAMSMSKSIVSILCGLALEDGYFKNVDDPVVRYLPELDGTAYAKVTIRNLLTMRSGVAWQESGPDLERQRSRSADEEQIYYEDFAAQAKTATAPGSAFNYSTADTQVLGWALSRAIGRNVADYMSERLWKPAGMESTGYWTLQGPSGRQREFYGAGFNATLRDYGRLGQLVLNGGNANGKQVVPRAWIHESTDRGAPPKPYMYLWWAGALGDRDFAAMGYRGQQIYVDPSSQVVIVVLSYLAGDEPPGIHTAMLQAVTRELRK